MEDSSTIVDFHIPCDNCGSSDANNRYSDGHQYCFACDTYKKGDKETMQTETKTKNYSFIEGTIRALPARKITEETCKKYGYSVGTYNGETVHIANYTKDGLIVGQKIRTKDKTFKWIGGQTPVLFGQDLFAAGGTKIVITEGEIDCLSVSQAGGNNWPCVSIPHGAQSAVKAIKNSLEYLESFKEIVFMFDMDDPGQKAARECVGLVTPGKGKIAALPMKDPNELLVAGRNQEITNAIHRAITHTPSGLRVADEMWEDMNTPMERGLSYPWPSLTRLTYGMRRGELYMIGSGTGMGKSTCMKEIAYWLLTEHKENVALFFLEESNKVTLNSLLSLKMRKPLHLPDVVVDMDDKKKAFDSLFKNENLHLYDHFGSTDWEDIKIRIRFLAISCNVKYIFLDHITALTSGGQQPDERRAVDMFMTELASLVHELDICVFAISHLTTPENGSFEEGARVQIKHFRGSRSIGQWSAFLFSLERNQQAEDINERHTSTFRILKDRFSGESTGSTFKLKFNKQTQHLEEVAPNNVFDAPVQESTNDYAGF